MAALERKTGTQLFERGPRGSALTQAGERFAGYARRCVELLNETEAAVSSVGHERMVVAAPTSLSSAVFPAVLDAMAGKPVDLICRVAHSDESVSALLDGSVHAAFVLQRVLPRGLDSIRVARSPFIAVAEPSLAAAGATDPAELLRVPVVVHNWSERARQVHAMFANPRRSPDHPVRLVGTPDIAIKLARQSGYVAVVPSYAAVQELRQGTLRHLPLPDISLAMEIRLVHRAETANRRGIKVLHALAPALSEQLGGVT